MGFKFKIHTENKSITITAGSMEEAIQLFRRKNPDDMILMAINLDKAHLLLK